jgi:hypothetical protein
MPKLAVLAFQSLQLCRHIRWNTGAHTTVALGLLHPLMQRLRRAADLGGETVDFSDPALPPGFDAEKINTGIALAVAKIEERGWQGDTCMIVPDETAGPMVAIDAKELPAGARFFPKPYRETSIVDAMIGMLSGAP